MTLTERHIQVPASPTFLSRLMAVAEALDCAEPALHVHDRARLLGATVQLCENQGIAATPEAMAAEVDRQLAMTDPDLKPVTTHFAWRRPRSRVEREQETAQLDRWPRHLFRPAVPGEAPWATLPWLAGVGISTCTLTHMLVLGHLFVGGGLAGLFVLISGTLGWRDWSRRFQISPLPALDWKKMTKWRHWYVARAHVRECLAHSGELMNRDADEVERRILKRGAEIEKDCAVEQREKQWAEMAGWSN